MLEMPCSHLEDEIRILPFSTDDLDCVLKIENSVYTLPWSRESYTELLLLDSTRMWVAKRDATLVGYMLYQMSPQEFELHTIAVAPNMQRRGIGKQLLERLLMEAQRSRIARIFLQVRPSNRAAFELYRAFDFHVVGVRKKYYQDNLEDAYVMCRELTEFAKA